MVPAPDPRPRRRRRWPSLCAVCVLGTAAWFAFADDRGPSGPRPLVGGVAVSGDGTLLELLIPEQVAEFYTQQRDPRHPLLHAPVEGRLRIDGGAEQRIDLHARGNNSATRADKSLTLDLRRTTRITPLLQLQRCYLLNLAFDPHRIETRLCTDWLGDLGLFPARTVFVRLVVNGDYQGPFLLVERPRDAIRREHRGVVSVLRTTRKGHEVRWNRKGVDPRLILKELEAAHTVGDADERAARFARLVDVEALCGWVAFNSLVRNADSVDELFLFEVRRTDDELGRLGLMGWDYDDLMSPAAHPDFVLE
ncbi:MAG: CotH kinase family protein, partial [Planctomycetes bacterium]|nr:CotH kinase family protein [Planctomycetota bacterium]